MRFSWDYPKEGPYDPFWGVRTSTIDWCEENYLLSPYFAEFINTITNAVFIGLAIYTIRNVIRQGHETRFLVIALGFGMVGAGSWLFHMTLKYEFQLMDELPMIYATCVPSWSLLSYNISDSASGWLAAFFVFVAAAVTAVYLRLRDPIFHQAAYAILTATVLFRSIYLMVTEVKEDRARKDMIKTMLIGIFMFLAGFILWIIDNEACEYLRASRRQWGLPWAFLLEFHGLWHGAFLPFLHSADV